MEPRKIFIIAGEASGDLLGSQLMKSLRASNPNISFIGIGGELMENEGLNSIFPIGELSIMGFVEILPKALHLLGRIRQTAHRIIEERPDLVLTIDSPAFSFRVMKKVAKMDGARAIKRAHVIAPSVWAYGAGRAKKISKLYDLLLCILPFEPPYFEKYGLRTVFIGHPLFGALPNFDFDSGKFLSSLSLDNNSRIISITPGSRRGEVKRILPIMLETLDMVRAEGMDFETFVLAAKNTEDLVETILKEHNFSARIFSEKDDKYMAAKSSTLAFAKSGTNTLEFSAAGVATVIMYRTNPLTAIIANIIVKSKYASLVNIIKDREIVPEFIGFKAKKAPMALKILELLGDRNLRDTQVAEARDALRQMGYDAEYSPSDLGAKEILELLHD